MDRIDGIDRSDGLEWELGGRGLAELFPEVGVVAKFGVGDLDGSAFEGELVLADGEVVVGQEFVLIPSGIERESTEGEGVEVVFPAGEAVEVAGAVFKAFALGGPDLQAVGVDEARCWMLDAGSESEASMRKREM